MGSSIINLRMPADLPDDFRHSRKDVTDICDLCEREQLLTYHHLIPRTNHSNKWFKKNFDKRDMTHRGLWLCRACHKMIHKTFAEKELGRHYNTLSALAQAPQIARFVDWVKTQK
ncbi:MAG: hypothetical protein AAF267_03130 [Deinococcota bacterium]